MLSLIVATDLDGLIGRAGALPWHVPADLGRFRNLTWGRTVVMGRRTFQSLPRRLDGRDVVVLSATLPPGPGYRVVPTAAGVLALLGPTCDAFVAGGAGVYEAFLPLCCEAHLTIILARHGEPREDDVYFPAAGFPLGDWGVVREERRDGVPLTPDHVYYHLRRREPLEPPSVF